MSRGNTLATSGKLVGPPDSISCQLVQLDKLVEDPEFQRAPTLSHVDRIATNFNYNWAGVLVAAVYQGKLLVIDGAHRLRAMRKLGIKSWLCEVIVGLSQQQLYELFYQYNSSRLKLSKMELFRFALRAGAIVENEVYAVVVEQYRYLLPLVRNDYRRPEAIRAYVPLCSVVRDYGRTTLANVFGLFKQLFSASSKSGTPMLLPKATNHAILQGAAGFIARLKNTSSKKVAERLQKHKIDPEALLREAYLRAFLLDRSDLRERIAQVTAILQEAYNSEQPGIWQKASLSE